MEKSEVTLTAEERKTLGQLQTSLEFVPGKDAMAEKQWKLLAMVNLPPKNPDDPPVSIAQFVKGLQKFRDQKMLDMILKTKAPASMTDLTSTPVATPGAGVMPLGQLVSMRQTLAPSGLYRLDRSRTIGIFFRPPDNMALQDAMTILRTEIEPEIKKLLPPSDGLAGLHREEMGR